MTSRRAAAAGDTGWLALPDDELLFRIESLPRYHARDDELIAVVQSNRHFFVRQEAAKRIRDPERLKAFADDRHIGQILARQMRRDKTSTISSSSLRESRHLEVRNAATVQLRLLKTALKRTGDSGARPTSAATAAGRGSAAAGPAPRPTSASRFGKPPGMPTAKAPAAFAIATSSGLSPT